MKLSVLDYVNCVRNDDFVIGIHQRDYKWNKTKVENLFASIYNGWIIPEIIGYKPIPPDDKTEIEVIDLNYNRIKFPESKDNIKDSIYILDGGQRTRSLYIGLFGSFTMGPLNNGVLYFNVSQTNKNNKIFAIYKNGNDVKKISGDIFIKVEYLLNNDDLSNLSVFDQLDIDCMRNIERFLGSLNDNNVIHVRYSNYNNDVATELFKAINTNVQTITQSGNIEALLKKHHKNIYDIIENYRKVDMARSTGSEWMTLKSIISSYFINITDDIYKPNQSYGIIENDKSRQHLNNFADNYEKHLIHLTQVDNYIKSVILKDDDDLLRLYEKKCRNIIFLFLQLYYHTFPDAIGNTTDDKFVRDTIYNTFIVYKASKIHENLEKVIKKFKTSVLNGSFRRTKGSWVDLTHELNKFYLVEPVMADYSDDE